MAERMNPGVKAGRNEMADPDTRDAFAFGALSLLVDRFLEGFIPASRFREEFARLCEDYRAAVEGGES